MGKERIYVCHTFYHAYVTFLKELNLRQEREKNKKPLGDATLLLSKLSNDFGSFRERAAASGLFAEVAEFDEKGEQFFPGLAKYREDTGNIAGNMIKRIQLTKKLAKAEEKYIPVNFREYQDIYVFCDSDPIGYYLNQKRIKYHALEDGLNSIRNSDDARFDNRGHFGLKAFMSEKLNLIFVQNGYGKYCIDMEINDEQGLKYPCKKYVVVPRKNLVDRLTQAEKDLILKAFVENFEELKSRLDDCKTGEDKILLLTEPLCSLDVRIRIFTDLIARYKAEGKIFLKPHPRDELDYGELFPEYPRFDPKMPMEMLNFFPDLHFKKVVGVFTELEGIAFADEKIRLGDVFMDQYEDPSRHWQNERI